MKNTSKTAKQYKSFPKLGKNRKRIMELHKNRIEPMARRTR